MRVAVLGCGQMGSGIVEIAARAGVSVVAWEVTRDAVEQGRERVSRSLERGIAAEKLTAEERDEALDRIRFSTELADMGDCRLVIEAIVEDLDIKIDLFRRVEGEVGSEAVLASNTSSLTITDMAAALSRPGRLIGMHFFNPVPVMGLVEIVPTLETPDEVLAVARDFVQRLGKTSVTTSDRSGFVVNRLLVPFILDAVRSLEGGVATVEQLDRAMVLGCGHPMGPLALCDLVGIDTVCRIAEIMYEEYRESRFAPPPLLRRLRALGRLGRKAGRGFYDYSGAEPIPLDV